MLACYSCYCYHYCYYYSDEYGYLYNYTCSRLFCQCPVYVSLLCFMCNDVFLLGTWQQPHNRLFLSCEVGESLNMSSIQVSQIDLFWYNAPLSYIIVHFLFTCTYDVMLCCGMVYIDFISTRSLWDCHSDRSINRLHILSSDFDSSVSVPTGPISSRCIPTRMWPCEKNISVQNWFQCKEDAKGRGYYKVVFWRS